MTQLLIWLVIITCLFTISSLVILYFQGFFHPRNSYHIYNLPPPSAANFGLTIANLSDYEYQPSMMHAKAILVDNHWVSLGSANFDPRSFFHNDELNLSTTNPSLVGKIEHFFLNALNRSQNLSFISLLRCGRQSCRAS